MTATGQTQGWRDNDLCWTVEGELVFCSDRVQSRHHRRRVRLSPIDGRVVSQRASTTIKVAERVDLDPDIYFTLIADGLQSKGYATEVLENPDEAIGYTT